MANVEFFRYFGASAKWETLGFIKPSRDGLFLFLSNDIDWFVFTFDLLITPLLFIFLCRVIRPFSVDFFFQIPKGKKFCVLLLLVGLFAQYAPLKNDLNEALSENALLTFFKYLAIGDELKGEFQKNYFEVIDPEPLPHPNLKEPEWFFPELKKYPLIKATAHQLCLLNKWDPVECSNLDEDNDGFVLKEDCNDNEPGINPKAKDIPRNGIDEDCSGLDAEAPNLIFIHWEGARAVNVTGLGYVKPATPRFSKIVNEHGVLFENAYATAIQTRYSLISVYASILPRLSSRWIFKYNPNLQLLGFPRLLKEQGYETIYTHGGSINYAHKASRTKEWFNVRLDQHSYVFKDKEKLGWGLTDRAFFETLYQYLKERKSDQPFFLTAASLSLHYPFYLPEEKFAIGPHEDKNFQVANIMAYADDVLGDFLEKILKDPQFENTLIIVAGDHGLNHHDPHNSSGRSRLWEDAVWVPLALIGKGWNIAPGTRVKEIRSLVDIGPTFLDRAGLSSPNHYIGKSLLRRYPNDRQPQAFFGKPDGGLSAGLRVGKWKYFVDFYRERHWLFDMEKDRQERKNLALKEKENQTRIKKFFDMITAVYVENTRLIKENKIWNWDYLL